MQVYAAATSISEPYSAEYNVLVVVQAPGWTPENQLVYLLSPWFGYLQVISPGIFGMSYRVSPNNQFDVPGLSLWNLFLASWKQAEGEDVIWNFGFTNPNDGAQFLQLVDPVGSGNSLILEPVSNSGPGSYTNFTLVALAEGTNYPAC